MQIAIISFFSGMSYLKNTICTCVIKGGELWEKNASMVFLRLHYRCEVGVCSLVPFSAEFSYWVFSQSGALDCTDESV